MPSQSAPAPSPAADDSWPDISRHALALAEALRAIAPGQPPKTQAACVTYASLVDEIAHLASTHGTVPPSVRSAPGLARKQLQDFGRLLRDKRNQAGFSRLQLARKAKLSDATIKFIETARHPPSRATLLRLIGVEELGLRWSDTPGYSVGAVSDSSTESKSAPPDAEFSRFDSRLTLPMVLESMLVLDELRISLHAVEVTAYGARHLCCLCGARSEAWTLDPREAIKLPLRHAAPCAARFADSLWERFPVLSELAHQERLSLRSLTATALEASLREIHRERFYGCRSGAELAAQLARATGLAPTPYRVGVGTMLLWSLGLGLCPVEPTEKSFSAHRAERLAQLLRGRSVSGARENSRLRGVADAAAWLVDLQAPLARPQPALPERRRTRAAPRAGQEKIAALYPSGAHRMDHPKAERCPCCGYASMIPLARPGRVVRYRNAALTLPADLRLPTCRRCKYESFGLDALPPKLLESLYRDNLRHRVTVAIARMQGFKSQRKTELLLNLSQGYLSRLKAGDGIPGAPLVSLLAILAAHPQLIGELEDYWTMPPAL